jgi:hypothetical protein
MNYSLMLHANIRRFLDVGLGCSIPLPFVPEFEQAIKNDSQQQQKNNTLPGRSMPSLFLDQIPRPRQSCFHVPANIIHPDAIQKTGPG